MTSIPSSARRLVTRRRVAVVLSGAALLGVLAPTVSARQQDVPANTAEPTISGSPAQGQTLTAAPGTWTGTPAPTFAYQWLRCPPSGGAANGSDCATIDGAISSVTPYQSKRISAAARSFMGRDRKAAMQACRFDIVAVSPYHWPRHIANAFEGDQ